MPRLTPILVALFFFAVAFTTAPADAQVIPDPHAGKTYVVRDASGKIVERLIPDGDQFQLIDPIQQKRIGWVKKLSSRLIFYNMSGHTIGTAKFELLPAGTSVGAIAVVRDPLGRMIGLLGRY